MKSLDKNLNRVSRVSKLVLIVCHSSVRYINVFDHEVTQLNRQAFAPYTFKAVTCHRFGNSKFAHKAICHLGGITVSTVKVHRRHNRCHRHACRHWYDPQSSQFQRQLVG